LQEATFVNSREETTMRKEGYKPPKWGWGLAALFGATLLASAAQAAAPRVAPDQMPTPRDAQGHPVLTGLWTGSAPAQQGPRTAEQLINSRQAIGRGETFVDFQARDGTFLGYEEDNRLFRRNDQNKPLYKPEYWEVVAENDYWANWRDPMGYCLPFGVPRMGAPTQILKLEGEPMIDLVYNKTFYPFNAHRLVPTDGRPHNKAQVEAETWIGDPVGRWEGDTLVIESIGFTDASWLGADGWIHGFKMKVTERLTRKGNSLLWEATVEDPEYLQEPWVMTPQTIYLNTNPNAVIGEALPCDARIGESWGTEANPKGWHVH
jgi:hypothetical protein